MEIVIASHNVHKIRELRFLFKEKMRHDILSLHHFPHYTSNTERGKSFQENASIKASHAAKELKKWVLADDSGLIVPALNGKPGLLSKWYAGDDATDRENRQKLLDELEGKTDLERAAFYECCLALASPDGEIQQIALGMCEGKIAHSDRGSNGFGYDAIFVKHDYEKTFAELDETSKIRVSHRSKAFSKMSLFLEKLNPKSFSPKTVKV